jgi:nucleoside-diphosphate-sugar epimerase
MTTVLVTGGRGFLGSHLVSRLRQDGYRVRIFARPRPEDPAGGSTDPDVFLGDIRDPDAVSRAVQGVDKVIHTVSNFRKGGSDRDDAHAINVQGTENVLQACRENNVERLVHCSTIGVHGDVREIPATETTPFNPCDLYQETKLIAERKVWDFAARHGLPVAVVRPISMFGPGDTRMLKLFRMIKKGRFIKIGPCRAYFQPAYIDDVVDGFMLCLTREEALGEAFIIGGEEYLPLEELFRTIAEELGVPPPGIRIPLFPVLVLAAICEMICVPLGLEPPLHRRRVSFFRNNRAFSVAKAGTLLGYRSKTSLREALRKTIAWYEQQGWL